MTREEFVEDAMYELDNSFNAARPEHKRVKRKKDKQRVRKGLGLGYDKREAGKDRETIRRELKEEMFGGIWAMLLSFIISNWGDDIIAWILKMLFPTTSTTGVSNVA